MIQVLTRSFFGNYTLVAIKMRVKSRFYSCLPVFLFGLEAIEGEKCG